jgi:hypothetical protein
MLAADTSLPHFHHTPTRARARALTCSASPGSSRAWEGLTLKGPLARSENAPARCPTLRASSTCAPCTPTAPGSAARVSGRSSAGAGPMQRTGTRNVSRSVATSRSAL